jgi:hypothetical protein
MTLMLCGHCGMYHGPQCPNVKKIEYNPDGTLKSVEYHQPPAQYLAHLGNQQITAKED